MNCLLGETVKKPTCFKVLVLFLVSQLYTAWRFFQYFDSRRWLLCSQAIKQMFKRHCLWMRKCVENLFYFCVCKNEKCFLHRLRYWFQTIQFELFIFKQATSIAYCLRRLSSDAMVLVNMLSSVKENVAQKLHTLFLFLSVNVSRLELI